MRPRCHKRQVMEFRYVESAESHCLFEWSNRRLRHLNPTHWARPAPLLAGTGLAEPATCGTSFSSVHNGVNCAVSISQPLRWSSHSATRPQKTPRPGQPHSVGRGGLMFRVVAATSSAQRSPPPPASSPPPPPKRRKRPPRRGKRLPLLLRPAKRGRRPASYVTTGWNCGGALANRP